MLKLVEEFRVDAGYKADPSHILASSWCSSCLEQGAHVPWNTNNNEDTELRMIVNIRVGTYTCKWALALGKNHLGSLNVNSN